MARILAGCITALLIQQARSEEVWIGTGGGNWSTDSNWLDGSAPVPGGGDTLAVRFMGKSRTGVTARNDLGNAFALNQLVLDHDYGTGLGIVSSGSPLRFTGSSPVIQIGGFGDTILSGMLELGASSGTVTVHGTGVGDLTISAAIRESSPGQGIVINAAAPAWNTQLITLSPDSFTSFSGDVTLKQGNLVVSRTLGTGVLKIEGGTLRGTGGAGAVRNPISLGADLVVTGRHDLTLEGVISSANAGTGISLRAGRVDTHGRAPILTLHGSSTYTGATTIDYNPSSAAAYYGGGILDLMGTGSLSSSSRYEIRGGGMLRWTGAGSRNALGDSAPIQLQSGQLHMRTVAVSATETAGALTVSGASTITVDASFDGSATLALSSLKRSDRGTVLFRGAGLGSTLGANVGNIVFTTKPTGLVGARKTGARRSILPYAIGDTTAGGSGNSFVTYSPETGIRPLDIATEYATKIPAGVSAVNVRLASSATLKRSATVNSLLLPGGVDLLGNARLTIKSGALLTLGSSTSVHVPLSFGKAEANIFAISDLTLSGILTGTNGLTKSGGGTLTLNGKNRISGPLTINAGEVAFSSVANLGANTTAIILNGVNPALVYDGSEVFTLSRPVEIKGGIGRLESSSSTLIVSLPITGSGGLEIGGGSAGVVRTLSPNTYSGPTILSRGTLEIGSDASLGQGGLFFAPSGHPVATLRLLGDWIANREVQMGGDGAIDTAGFDASLSGVLTGAGTLMKKGAGTLTLNTASPFTGELAVAGGTFHLAGQGRTRSSKFSISSGGRLLLDNSTTAFPSRLASTAAVTLAGGELQIVGNAATPTAETLAGLTISTGGMNTVTLQVPGNGPATLKSETFSNSLGYLLVRGDRLGGGSETAYSRFVLPTAPASAHGFLARIYASDQPTGGGESFAVYESNVDAAGIVGVKPLSASAYTVATNLGSPAVPGSANVLVSGVVSTGAPKAAAHSLTFDPASNLSVGAGQTLTIGSGQILVRSGGDAASITGGGVLDFGATTGTLAAFGDLTLDVAVTGKNGWIKTGPGTLTLGAQPGGGPQLGVEAGAVKPLTKTSLSQASIRLGTPGVLKLDGGDAELGAVSGQGIITLGSSTLTLGTLPSSSGFSGSITGNGTLRIVDGGNPDAVRMFLTASPHYSGNIDLRSGWLSLPSEGALGSGIIEANGGGLLVNGALKQSLMLKSDLRLRGGSALIEGPVSVSGPGGLSIERDLYTTVRTALDYQGETRVIGTLSLNGAGGALPGTSAIRVLGTGRLLLDDGSGSSSSASGRLRDSMPVWLEGGSLSFTGYANATSKETFGNLHVKGSGNVGIYQPNIAGTVTLQAAKLVREGRATVAFNGINGGEITDAAATRLFFREAPALLGGSAAVGPNTSVIPWAYSTDGSLVTYSPQTGVRSLTTADFANGPAAVTAPTNNLLINSDTVLNSALTVNSLYLTSGSERTLSGSGTLRITSGVVSSGAFLRATINNPLEFGSKEAMVIADEGNIMLSGPISGTGGLTKGGSANVFLTGTNSFSGPININEGGLYFSSWGSLGEGASPIILHGESRLVYHGTTNVVLDRGFQLEGGRGVVSTEERNTTLTLAGEIAGSGELLISGQGTTVLAGNSTYTGATHLYADTVITSGAALGNGGPVYMHGYRLKTEAPWITDRNIIVDNGGIIDTGAHDVVWNGPLTGRSFLWKVGSGSLTIRDADAFYRSLKIGAGTVVLEGDVPGGLDGSAADIEVSASGRLTGSANIGKTLNIYGTVAPGLGVGTLSSRDVRFRANSKLELELLSAQEYDRLSVAGWVALDGQVHLTLNLHFDPTDHLDSFLLIDNDERDFVHRNSGAGQFAYMGMPLEEGSLFQSGEQMFQISYKGGDGNDVVLYAVPEPGTAAALLTGFGVIATRRLRRRERIAA